MGKGKVESVRTIFVLLVGSDLTPRVRFEVTNNNKIRLYIWVLQSQVHNNQPYGQDDVIDFISSIETNLINHDITI